MRTILGRTVGDEEIQRIRSLNDMSTARWGKMNICQMMAHCVRYQDMILHGSKQKQTLSVVYSEIGS
jgi:hypothetical protein